MPDLIRDPGFYWIPAWPSSWTPIRDGMTNIKVFCCRINIIAMRKNLALKSFKETIDIWKVSKLSVIVS